MRKLTFFITVLIFSTQAAFILAQVQEKAAPKITLTLSEWREGGLPANYHRLDLMVKNISNDVFYEPGCSNMRDLYHVSISFNGVLLAEKDAATRRRGEAEQAAFCTHEPGINPIKPGESFEILLELSGYYDMSKPGTYEVGVSRETDPDHPDKSVTVKSNTITIVVPEPEAYAPK
ncbi:MAG: hypothetical protein ACLQVL_01305 [Terriglobia bacterium]